MTKRMLIDASHSEETRVAIIDENKLEEFLYESALRKPLKGNIFLAKVTRVEPSLQAAFVNFGGNRHGFLPFSEIHPDYFRIPIADQEEFEAMQREQLEEHDKYAARALEDNTQDTEDEAQNDDIEGEADDADEADNSDASDTTEDATEETSEGDDKKKKPVRKSRAKKSETKAANSEKPVEKVGPSEGEEKSDKKAKTDDKEDKPAKPKRVRKTAKAKAEEAAAKDAAKGTDTKDSKDSDKKETKPKSKKSEEKSDDKPKEASEEKAADGEKAPTAENEGNNNNNRRSRGGRGRGRGGKDGNNNNNRSNNNNNRGRGGNNRGKHQGKRPENFGDDEQGQASRFRFNLRRKYKIQEVIKRGQIMLIQVAREERGNKGAAVSSYLSLPGRYCVLMPNSPRGGGVSRKISNFGDRSKMKDLMGSLEVPAGMSTIVRTAGLERTKTEVKRDLDYLMRLWNSIRELTLKSSAPALVYEEANLLKRSVRDLYTRDVEEVLVAGGDAYKTSKEFMKMLIPSHAKKVKHYEDTSIPLFQRYQVEKQIAEIGETEVTLPSGGYLVINPTEALVSIDVNSGRSTKERNIEGTALKTNLEAAEEVARQLRLRDLGGLVVIDFIDMEHRGNNGKVERRMRDSLANDKARIQVGRISSFGLMELSRQRLNASLSEAQYETCSNCEGRGLTRTADASSLLVLRAIEAEGVRKRAAQVIVHVPSNVALFLLNHKRGDLAGIEERYAMQILIRVDDDLPASKHLVEVSKPSDNGDESESNETAHDNVREDQNDNVEKPDGEKSRNRRGGRSRGGRGRNRNNNRDDNNDGNTSEPNGNAIPAEPNDKNGNVIPADPQDKDGNAVKGAKAPRKRAPRKPRTDLVDPPKAKTKPVEKKEDAPKAEKAPAKEKAEPKAKKPTAPKPVKEEASNSNAPKEPAPASEHEVINEAPKKKKKGWWNKL